MKTSEIITVALADDHTMMRKGLVEILSKFENIQVILEASDGKELIDKLNKTKSLPSICVLDINMKNMNGYETASAIRRLWPEIKIIALSMYENEANIIKMLRHGASGYVLKDNEPDELQRAIVHVFEHGYYHSDLVTGKMIRQITNPSFLLTSELSDREMQFLLFCCTELTYKEIANEMKLSPKTIDGQRDGLFTKLGVKSRTGLIMFAIHLGVIPH